MEPAIAGVEFDVPATLTGFQAARWGRVGSASSFFPTCHPGTVGLTVWGVDLPQPLFRRHFAVRTEWQDKITLFDYENRQLLAYYMSVSYLCAYLLLCPAYGSYVAIVFHSFRFCMSSYLPTYFLLPPLSVCIQVAIAGISMARRNGRLLYITTSSFTSLPFTLPSPIIVAFY